MNTKKNLIKPSIDILVSVILLLQTDKTKSHSCCYFIVYVCIPCLSCSQGNEKSEFGKTYYHIVIALIFEYC